MTAQLNKQAIRLALKRVIETYRGGRQLPVPGSAAQRLNKSLTPMRHGTQGTKLNKDRFENMSRFSFTFIFLLGAIGNMVILSFKPEVCSKFAGQSIIPLYSLLWGGSIFCYAYDRH